MSIYLILLLFALGIWFDLVVFRWLRKRWPTFAVLLALVWVASSLVQAYRYYNRPTL